MHNASIEMHIDRKIDTVIYIAPISEEVLGASVAEEMSFQRLSKRVEGESRPPKPGWKVVPQHMTRPSLSPV